MKRGSASALSAEACGLRWLARARAEGGAPATTVVRLTHDALETSWIPSRRPDTAAAATFGTALSATHRAGAEAYGTPPPDAPEDGWIAALRLPYEPAERWAPWYARARVLPFLRCARDRGAVDPSGTRTVEAVCQRLLADDEDLAGPAEPVSRLHGDLWSGNVVFGPDPDRPGEGTGWLIDPAAHGGHRETDLAMLALFGFPLLDDVLSAYGRAAADAGQPLSPGWRDRVPLHQLFPLLVHAVLFGGGYGDAAVAAASRYR